MEQITIDEIREEPLIFVQPGRIRYRHICTGDGYDSALPNVVAYFGVSTAIGSGLPAGIPLPWEWSCR